MINDKSSFFHFVFMVIKKYILIAICTVVSCADSFADYATWTRATLRRLLLFLLSSKVGKAVCAVNSIRLRKLMIFMKRIFVDLSLMKTVSSTTLYNPSTTIKLEVKFRLGKFATLIGIIININYDIFWFIYYLH